MTTVISKRGGLWSISLGVLHSYPSFEATYSSWWWSLIRTQLLSCALRDLKEATTAKVDFMPDALRVSPQLLAQRIQVCGHRQTCQKTVRITQRLAVRPST